MKKSDKTGTMEGFDLPAMTAAMMAISPIASKGWLDIMSESTRFMTDRLQKDLDTQKAMLACKSPAELLKVQSEFYKATLEQYTEEFTRLCEMMSKATNDAVQDAQSGHSRRYDDIPL